MRLNREQMICIGSFCLLLMACAFAVGASLQARSDAGQELAERRDALSHLQTRVRSALDGRSRKAGGAAPPLAFLDAATPGLAAAQLQSYLSQVIASHNATLISYGTEPTHREDFLRDGPGAGRSGCGPESTAGAALRPGKSNAVCIRRGHGGAAAEHDGVARDAGACIAPDAWPARALAARGSMKRYPNRSMLVLVLAAAAIVQARAQSSVQAQTQPRRRVICATPLRRFCWTACRSLASGPCSLPAAGPRLLHLSRLQALLHHLRRRQT